MAGAMGPTVTLHKPSSAFFMSWAPWTKSPETLTSVASGARRRKVTVRSGATSQNLTAGGALPRPPRPAGAAGTCASRRGVHIKEIANRDSLDMPWIVSILVCINPGLYQSMTRKAIHQNACQIGNEDGAHVVGTVIDLGHVVDCDRHGDASPFCIDQGDFGA